MRPRSKRARLNWPNIFWNALLHGGALAAPFTFAWWGVGLMLVLWWISGGLGICLGFHRLFTHRSFETYRPVRWLIAWLGSLAGQGHVITWVADHRKHHARSDREGDPHSPVDGAWWSHMVWLAWTDGSEAVEAHRRRWAPDLLKDPGLRLIDRMFFVSNFLLAGALFGVGYWLGGLPAALTAVVWGVFVRLVFVLHATFLVNSATHMWGYRNYPTRDNSRNLWWVALLTYGEGWHNNHHAYPRMARCGHRWWEIDLTYLTIRLLAALGLAWNVVDRQHQTARRS
jgi:stearoyl-CoA desaturase (delta-9 desaturase)